MKTLIVLLSIGLMSSATFANNSTFNPFIPQGFNLLETHCQADFNKDGKKDCVLFIKDTQKSAWETNIRGELVDRNRRGVVIVFKTNNGYQKMAENKALFASENEEGGVYFAPELGIEAKDNKLEFDYGHGRYGSWTYTFDYRKVNGVSDFYWIGYDRFNNYGPYIKSIDSVNFLTHKYLHRSNTVKDFENEKTKFKDTWYNLPKQPLIKLSQIQDIDETGFELESQLYHIANPKS